MVESAAESLVASVLTQHRISYDHVSAGWCWRCSCPAWVGLPRPAPQELASEADALAAAHVAHEVLTALADAGLDLRGTRWVVGR